MYKIVSGENWDAGENSGHSENVLWAIGERERGGGGGGGERIK